MKFRFRFGEGKGKLRGRSHGLLWFGEEEKDRWSISDPASRELNEALHRLRYESKNEQSEQLRRDIHIALRAAEDYQHLTSYALGVEHIIRKLRVIWRAVRNEGT